MSAPSPIAGVIKIADFGLSKSLALAVRRQKYSHNRRSMDLSKYGERSDRGTSTPITEEHSVNYGRDGSTNKDSSNATAVRHRASDRSRARAFLLSQRPGPCRRHQMLPSSTSASE